MRKQLSIWAAQNTAMMEQRIRYKRFLSVSRKPSRATSASNPKRSSVVREFRPHLSAKYESTSSGGCTTISASSMP